MVNTIFKQDPSCSPETYELRSNDVLITMRTPFLTERRYSLYNINPNPKTLKQRNMFMILFFCFLSVLSGFGAWVASKTSYAAPWSFFLTVFSAGGVWQVIENSRVNVVACFFDTNGKVLFKLYRTKKTRFDYDDFIELLMNRVRENQKAWDTRNE